LQQADSESRMTPKVVESTSSCTPSQQRLSTHLLFADLAPRFSSPEGPTLTLKILSGST
jgi:hypothetical protein